jgi:hypothetical protein
VFSPECVGLVAMLFPDIKTTRGRIDVALASRLPVGLNSGQRGLIALFPVPKIRAAGALISKVRNVRLRTLRFC